MEELYAKVESEIGSKICETYDKSPFIKIIEGKVVLLCCCDNFKIQCYKEIIEMLTDYKEKNMTVAWKKSEKRNSGYC